MKKILFLVLTLFCLNCFAGFMSKSRMLDPDTEALRPFHQTKKRCYIFDDDCIKVPKKYDKHYFAELDTEVDDPERPKYSKNEIDSCGGEADCEAKLALKVCTDQLEKPLIDQFFTEIYCSTYPTPIGYYKKTVKQIRIDPLKKAAYDAAQNEIKDQEKEENDILKDMKAKLKNGEAWTPEEEIAFKKHVLKNLR